jgi:hypothetical protein
VETVYRSHGGLVWRAVLAMSAGSREVADEATSEAFARLFAYREGVRDPVAWVFRTAFGVARKELGRQRVISDECVRRGGFHWVCAANGSDEAVGAVVPGSAGSGVPALFRGLAGGGSGAFVGVARCHGEGAVASGTADASRVTGASGRRGCLSHGVI